MLKMATTPKYCEPKAFSLFLEQLDQLHTTKGLLTAAIAVALNAFDDVDHRRVLRDLRGYGDRVLLRVHGPQPQARVAHLHDVFFQELGFLGNMDNYFTPLNHYLPVVLQTRRAGPHILCLIYKAVAEYLGLPVQGLHVPGHFVVRVHAGHRSMIIDPFFFGTLRTPADIARPWSKLAASGRTSPESVIQVATHAEWLTCILKNLEHVFEVEKRYDGLAAMVELRDTLSRARV